MELEKIETTQQGEDSFAKATPRPLRLFWSRRTWTGHAGNRLGPPLAPGPKLQGLPPRTPVGESTGGCVAVTSPWVTSPWGHLYVKQGLITGRQTMVGWLAGGALKRSGGLEELLTQH